MRSNAESIEELNIRDLGGLTDNPKITAHFPQYRVEEHGDAIYIEPDFHAGDVPDIQFGYGKSGQNFFGEPVQPTSCHQGHGCVIRYRCYCRMVRRQYTSILFLQRTIRKT